MMSRRGPVVALVVWLLAAVVAPAAAQQAPTPEARADRMRDLEVAIGEASAEEAAALRELAAIRSRRATLDESLRVLGARIDAAEATVATHQVEIDRLAAALAELDRQIAQTSARLDVARSRAEESIADLYLNTSGGIPAQVGLLAVDDVGDVVTGSVYLSDITKDRWSDVDTLAGLKDDIELLEADAARQRTDAEAARAAAEVERQALAELRVQQQYERDEIAAEEARERALVASIRDRRDEFAAELATLQVSSNAITDMLLARQRSQTRASSFTVARPVPGVVTSGFGGRTHPVLGDTRVHNGIDMRVAHGAPIKAAADGVVAFAGVRSGYGNTVIIDHGNQYATLYAHASTVLATAGESVEAGETVAEVGATGLATGPHLHFEVRLLGVPANPLNYLK